MTEINKKTINKLANITPIRTKLEGVPTNNREIKHRVYGKRQT